MARTWKRAKPPNYRLADPARAQACAGCRFFTRLQGVMKLTRRCTRFGRPVSERKVCDDFRER